MYSNSGEKTYDTSTLFEKIKNDKVSFYQSIKNTILVHCTYTGRGLRA